MPVNSMANLAKIEKYLKDKKIKHKISDLGGDLPAGKAGIYKVEDVIKAGVNPDQILKTLIIRSTVNPQVAKASRGWEGLEFKNKYFAIALRGKDRVDFKKVKRLFGGKSELAKPAEVQKVAGVPVGAVCPILLNIPVYFDRKAMDLKHVNMGSGDLTRELEMDFSDLLGAIGEYKIIELTSAVDK